MEELLTDESLKSVGLVVLHDKISPPKYATLLRQRLMATNLLKSQTTVLVLYSGQTPLARKQGPSELEVSGKVRQNLQVFAWVFVHNGFRVQKYIAPLIS